MIGSTWMKWTAGTAMAVAVAALPAVGQARAHYTGKTPSSVQPVAHVQTTKKTSKLATTATHKKHKLHTKKHATKKLHAAPKAKHHALSTSKSKKA